MVEACEKLPTRLEGAGNGDIADARAVYIKLPPDAQAVAVFFHGSYRDLPLSAAFPVNSGSMDTQTKRVPRHNRFGTRQARRRGLWRHAHRFVRPCQGVIRGILRVF